MKTCYHFSIQRPYSAHVTLLLVHDALHHTFTTWQLDQGIPLPKVEDNLDPRRSRQRRFSLQHQAASEDISGCIEVPGVVEKKVRRIF